MNGKEQQSGHDAVFDGVSDGGEAAVLAVSFMYFFNQVADLQLTLL